MRLTIEYEANGQVYCTHRVNDGVAERITSSSRPLESREADTVRAMLNAGKLIDPQGDVEFRLPHSQLNRDQLEAELTKTRFIMYHNNYQVSEGSFETLRTRDLGEQDYDNLTLLLRSEDVVRNMDGSEYLENNGITIAVSEPIPLLDMLTELDNCRAISYRRADNPNIDFVDKLVDELQGK